MEHDLLDIMIVFIICINTVIVGSIMNNTILNGKWNVISMINNSTCDVIINLSNNHNYSSIIDNVKLDMNRDEMMMIEYSIMQTEGIECVFCDIGDVSKWIPNNVRFRNIFIIEFGEPFNALTKLTDKCNEHNINS